MKIGSIKDQAIRAIVISSVQPEPTTAGQIKLYRHLAENTGIQLMVWPVERRLLARKRLRHRLIARLERTRLNRWVADAEMLQSACWLDKHLPAPSNDGTARVVITVAHGNGCWAARRYAHKYRLPLATFFDDWWPDMDLIHASLRRVLENRFRELYRQSQLALCVSEGMLAALGPHPNAQVLYPIPTKANSLLPPQTLHEHFRILYFGNLFDYGPILAEALGELKRHPQLRLEVRGGNPRWSRDFRHEMRQAGLWHDYAPRAELEEWLGSADAFLVPMVFEPTMRRRMETSFPSKVPEMAQLGKPLVIWGPEYCSAVQWARQGNRALCVTEPNPVALRQALEKLVASPADQQRLAAAARQAAQTEFNPDRIQAQFMQALWRVLKP
ncbi:MAG: glycosyltransferase [Negativicutes bacterium]|nr:glycosyltransferase [Negativicutes bacterium]